MSAIHFRFPFIEAPAAASVENSIAFLKEQAAITSDEKLTPIGQMLSQLPVDVVISKMLIMGALFHVSRPCTFRVSRRGNIIGRPLNHCGGCRAEILNSVILTLIQL